MDWLLGLTIPELTFLSITVYVTIGIVRLYVIFVIGFSLLNKVGDSKIGKVFLLPFFIFGWLYDVWLNWWLSIPMKDLPNKVNETITQRMKRYKADEPFSWRGKLAFWLCEKLNKYDEGHC